MPLTDENELLLTTFVERMDAREIKKSAAWAEAHETVERGKILKEGFSVVISLVVVVGVGTTYIYETSAKPTTEQVQEAIVEAVAPVSAETKALAVESHNMRDDISAIQGDMARVKKIQDFSLDQSVHMGDVLDHIAQKKKGPAPAKPQRLREKERELILPTMDGAR